MDGVSNLQRKLFNRIYHTVFKKVLNTLKSTGRYWGIHSTSSESAYWGNIKVIRDEINKKIAGSPQTTWYAKQILARKKPFGRVLTFGDGYGMAAEAFQRKRDTTEIVYLNISEGEGRHFAERLKLVDYDAASSFVLGDANKYDYAQLGMFDTIIDVGAFHHLENFEEAFPRINQILKPDGLMYIDEYVGPSKYQFSQKVVDLVNGQLASLPELLVKNRKEVTRSDFNKLWQNGIDHSEGIRSADLDAAMKRCFGLKECVEVGGTILLPFFMTHCLRPKRLRIANWHSTPEGNEAAIRLLRLEEELIGKGELPSDYCLYVFTHKS